VQTGRYKFLFILTGWATGHLLWADSTASPAAALNQPIPVHLPESSKDVVTVALVTPIPPKPHPLLSDEAMPATMIFHDVPVGMVAHIIGVRLGRKVEVETNATQLISGDFGHMRLTQALNEAAAKAGLAVIDEGSEGLHLVPRDSLPGKAGPGFMSPVSPAAITPIGKSADGPRDGFDGLTASLLGALSLSKRLAAERQREAAQQAADEKRIELLRLRAKLLLEEPDQ
jgi:hypothetical protein